MIFYLTATGNSLYVAKRLADVVGGIASIPQEMRREPQAYRDDAIGIVCPVFGHELPILVREFIARSSFEAGYFFVVGTYGCNRADFPEHVRSVCECAGRPVDYVNTVLMVDNGLTEFDMEEQMRIDPEKQVDAQIDAALADVSARRCYVQPVTEADRAHHREYLRTGSRLEQLAAGGLFRVTDACTGCGACIRVCPMGNIRFAFGAGGTDPAEPASLASMRAQHGQTRCIGCLACIHACQPRATVFAELSEPNPQARYRNPHVSLAEIIAANHQLG